MSLDYDFDASDLDEFLVEYVDGTMDPVVRGVFEEFLRVYPKVALHVDRLAGVRSQLCSLGDQCQCQAPPGFQDRLKQQLACENSTSALLEQYTPQLNLIALAFSITLLVLAVGLANDSREGDYAESIEAVEDTPRELVSLQTDIAWDARESMPHAHQISVADRFSAVFDRPVLMSVRHDLISLRPVVAHSASVIATLP